MNDNVLSVESVKRENGKVNVFCDIPADNNLIENVIINGERIEFSRLGLAKVSIDISADSYPTVKLEYMVIPRKFWPETGKAVFRVGENGPDLK